MDRDTYMNIDEAVRRARAKVGELPDLKSLDDEAMAPNRRERLEREIRVARDRLAILVAGRSRLAALDARAAGLRDELAVWDRIKERVEAEAAEIEERAKPDVRRVGLGNLDAARQARELVDAGVPSSPGGWQPIILAQAIQAEGGDPLAIVSRPALEQQLAAVEEQRGDALPRIVREARALGVEVSLPPTEPDPAWLAAPTEDEFAAMQAARPA